MIDQNEEIKSSFIHTYVDASQKEYGCVVYIRHVYKSGLKSIRFIASKSKVAASTSISIPRLELMSAILGLRLAHSVIMHLDYKTTMFWDL